MLDNRELAGLFWLGLVFLWVVAQKKTRPSLAQLLRSLSNRVILIPLLFLLAFICLEVWLGSRVGLWDTSLFKGTVLWAVVSALVLAFTAATNPAAPHFLQKAVLATVGAAVFLEFFLNLMVMDLWAELILQPVVAALVIFATVAGIDVKHRPIKAFAEGLTAIIGFFLLAFAVWQFHSHWDQLDHAQLLREFFLPMWLTIGLLPFLFLLKLYVPYDAAWRGINWATADRPARWRARAALVTSFHLRTRELVGFALIWCQRLADAPTFAEGRRVIAQYRRERRQAKQAATDEEKRLVRYAGVDGTDNDGRRLDRREFKGTMDSLRWIHTCQMGWYRNRGHYRTDLVQMLASYFTGRGLPADHGITLRVARDGQAWYAWRRAITGWCFAIGAAGPPPNMWELDGPEPPDGFPEKAPCWGRRPFSDGVNRNWR